MITLYNSKTQLKLYPELGNLVQKELERVTALMGFSNEWRFKISFCKIKGDAQANCATEWHYHLAKLNFDLSKMAKEPKEHQLATVRHELMHVACNRFVELIEALAPEHLDLVSKYEEEFCTFIEHMPVWSK